MTANPMSPSPDTALGGDGVIAENVRYEQRKVIKYNQLP
jgi:hypothetical protein